MEYCATSPITGQIRLDYIWTYCHSWYLARKGAVYIVDSTSTHFIPYSPSLACFVTSTGSITLDLEAGNEWGITLESSNRDSSRLNFGTFKIPFTQVPPTLLVPEDPLTTPSTSCSYAQVFDYSSSILATDCDGNAIVPECSPPPGSDFPIGMTTVTCTATDSNMLSTTKTFDVEVISPSQQAFLIEEGVRATHGRGDQL